VMSMRDDELLRFVEQSNMIEGITRPPTDAEIEAHKVFLNLPTITVADLEGFVAVVAPGKPLRREPHMNVRVGSHIAPAGGPDIEKMLQALLDDMHSGAENAWRIHCRFETIHPFLALAACCGYGRCEASGCRPDRSSMRSITKRWGITGHSRIIRRRANSGVQ
jgi:hypothetical protein